MKRCGAIVLVAGVIGAGFFMTTVTRAEEPASKQEPGPVEQIEESVKRAGQSIEDSVKKTVKQIEEEHLAEKVEKKLKQALDDTVEGLEQTGKAIEKKLQ